MAKVGQLHIESFKLAESLFIAHSRVLVALTRYNKDQWKNERLNGFHGFWNLNETLVYIRGVPGRSCVATMPADRFSCWNGPSLDVGVFSNIRNVKKCFKVSKSVTETSQ